ncbi:unnamed protein product [Lactuca saligna]|uniref:Homeobox domain-containing protein n=1 Tax=Lactuca saligna TaxID=75948 RepID=A0AA35Z3R0_LACSI|nr:unnamed protein product [Lactuca saligna]
MWMMGYNEAEDLNINMIESYTNNGSRKLRPLVPRPSCAAASSSHRFHSTHHDHHLLPINHHLVAAEQHKREFNSQQMVVVSSRWNPTPEQLQTLEELYRRGTRTPSADEIQHITAQLRRYGKIEGKNVFYWFQNHKARERQKRRRQLDNPTTDLHQPPYYTTDINNINIDRSIERKDPELNRTSYEVEETRNWAIPTFSEKVLRERTSKAESRVTSIADQGLIPVEQQDEEGNDQLLLLHRRRKSFPEKNATWKHMMQCLSSSTPPTNHNSTTIATTCIPATPVSKTSSYLVVSPQSHRHHHLHHDVESFQTLELFPVNSNGLGREQPDKCLLPTNDVNLSPRQFIEFLPLKN